MRGVWVSVVGLRARRSRNVVTPFWVGPPRAAAEPFLAFKSSLQSPRAARQKHQEDKNQRLQGTHENNRRRTLVRTQALRHTRQLWHVAVGLRAGKKKLEKLGEKKWR